MNQFRERVLFLLFFASGFCGLLYQVIWVRLAFASFGIITAVLSVVISVFMLGLCLGSWSGGQWIEALTRRLNISPLFFYALAEGTIGLGAFIVPVLFGWGEKLLLRSGESDSFAYLLGSAFILACSIFPWCFCMGTTFPFMMAFVKMTSPSSTRAFSFLYLANVIGAMAGTLLTAFVLVELLGFRLTLGLAGCLNFLIALVSILISFQSGLRAIPSLEETRKANPSGQNIQRPPWCKTILFTTGLASLGMEVAWTRAFTPVMGTQVYAFAILLAAYLLATWVGSQVYRRHIAHSVVRSTAQLLSLLSFLAFLPIVLNDPRLIPGGGKRDLRILLVILGIVPFCSLLGYLTPKLIDEFAMGNPRWAGRAYALNILGCILGPLLVSYLFLPGWGAQASLLILGFPFLAFYLVFIRQLSAGWRWTAGLASLAFLLCSAFISASYEVPSFTRGPCLVKRDHTATVIAYGRGMKKRLLVNGQGMTGITQITKFMAHLPLAFHSGSPSSAMVICFGMGTTYRSMLRWDIRARAVELVPSVVALFGYYFDDADSVLRNPKGTVVIDDGRRYLKRTDEQYDVITIDPPPPPETAGCSLLYSEDFYLLVRRHLKPMGILQQWYPVGKPGNFPAVARSLSDSFPYLRVFGSAEAWGYHFLASMSPIRDLTAEEMIQHMPEAARQDLLEWSDGKDLWVEVQRVLSREISLDQILSSDRRIKISDDRPYNEYFWLRQTFQRPICSLEVEW